MHRNQTKFIEILYPCLKLFRFLYIQALSLTQSYNNSLKHTPVRIYQAPYLNQFYASWLEYVTHQLGFFQL